MTDFLYHIFIVGIFLSVWFGGVVICRRCSLYFDDAKCRVAIKIKSSTLRRILISPTYLNYKKKVVFQSANEREKISLLGVLAHIAVNCTGLKLVCIVIQKEFFSSKQISDVKQALSVLVAAMIVAFFLEEVNNWRIFVEH